MTVARSDCAKRQPSVSLEIVEGVLSGMDSITPELWTSSGLRRGSGALVRCLRKQAQLLG